MMRISMGCVGWRKVKWRSCSCHHKVNPRKTHPREIKYVDGGVRVKNTSYEEIEIREDFMYDTRTCGSWADFTGQTKMKTND